MGTQLTYFDVSWLLVFDLIGPQCGFNITEALWSQVIPDSSEAAYLLDGARGSASPSTDPRAWGRGAHFWRRTSALGQATCQDDQDLVAPRSRTGMAAPHHRSKHQSTRAVTYEATTTLPSTSFRRRGCGCGCVIAVQMLCCPQGAVTLGLDVSGARPGFTFPHPMIETRGAAVKTLTTTAEQRYTSRVAELLLSSSCKTSCSTAQEERTRKTSGGPVSSESDRGLFPLPKTASQSSILTRNPILSASNQRPPLAE
jgi:hypothetical protein